MIVLVDWLWGYHEGGSLVSEGVMEDPAERSPPGLAMVLASIPIRAIIVLVKRLVGRPR